MQVVEKFSLSIDRIEFSSAKTLSYNAHADTSIDEIKAKAIHIDDETGKENIAGELIAHQIDLAELINDRNSIIMTLDDHSHQLSEFAAFFSDNEKVFSNRISYFKKRKKIFYINLSPTFYLVEKKERKDNNFHTLLFSLTESHKFQFKPVSVPFYNDWLGELKSFIFIARSLKKRDKN